MSDLKVQRLRNGSEGGDMDKPGIGMLFDTEYEAAVELAQGLTSREWDLPSLCEEWSVGEVVLHIAYHTHRDGLRETLPSMDKVTAKLIAREHADTRVGLLAWLARPVPTSAREHKGNVCELGCPASHCLGNAELTFTA